MLLWGAKKENAAYCINRFLRFRGHPKDLDENIAKINAALIQDKITELDLSDPKNGPPSSIDEHYVSCLCLILKNSPVVKLTMSNFTMSNFTWNRSPLDNFIEGLQNLNVNSLTILGDLSAYRAKTILPKIIRTNLMEIGGLTGEGAKIIIDALAARGPYQHGLTISQTLYDYSVNDTLSLIFDYAFTENFLTKAKEGLASTIKEKGKEKRNLLNAFSGVPRTETPQSTNETSKIKRKSGKIQRTS